ncbi:MAG TPA: peptide ABC transporter substrate-binding protein [Gemmatimonadales bacterium]
MRASRLVLVMAAVLAGCGKGKGCPRCDLLVIAATGEPQSLLPPLVVETVGRDISDQIYERLADLAAEAAPIEVNSYRPRLAARWERVDSLSWRFHLRPGARWQDGEPVTAGDVVFSFGAFSDSVLDPPARSSLSSIRSVSAEDSSTVVVRFDHFYPEQLYDATWHVRIMPAHIWRWITRDDWGADTAVSRLVGSGPYRVARWDRGQSLMLVADTAGGGRARIGTVVWRFVADPEAALNLVLAREADLLEALGSPERVARVEGDPALRTVRYPAAAYGFLGYQLAPQARGAVFGDRQIRRALNMAIDRSTIATAVYGPGSKAPPGPMSQLLWIWDDSITVLPYDTAAAVRILAAAGWMPASDGIRTRSGRRLGFDILVPSTSPGRRRLAEALQEQWRGVGAAVTVTAVDFPVFIERLGKGKFDSYIGAWLDEPSARSIAEQWTEAGIGDLNYGRYVNRAFDRQLKEAVATDDVSRARRAWRAAFDTLNADAPALFLYAPVNVAAVARRVEGLSVNPYEWLGGLSAMSLKPE